MAPKRKRPSRTPREAQPSPQAIHDANVMRLVKRTLVSGRPVILDDVPNAMDFEPNIRDVQCGIFLDLGSFGEPQPDHLRQFYASFVLNETNQRIHFRMYRRTYSYTFAELSEILRVPHNGDLIFFSHTKNYLLLCDQLSLTPDQLITPLLHTPVPLTGSINFIDQALDLHPRFINKIIISNILPRAGLSEKITINQLYVLHSLFTGTPINILYIMLKHMAGVVENNRGLSYGIHLNLLFSHIGLPTCPTTKITEPLDFLSLRHMKSGLDSHAHKRRRAEAGAMVEAGISSTHNEEGPSVPLDNSGASLTLEEFSAHVDLRFDHIDQRLNQQEAQMNTIIELLRQHTPQNPTPQ